MSTTGTRTDRRWSWIARGAALALLATCSPVPPPPPIDPSDVLGAQPAPEPALGTCAPRRWDFATTAGIKAEPSTVLLAPAPRVAVAPGDADAPGQAAGRALELPVRFGPLDYYLALDVPVCVPTPAANLRGKRLAVRLRLDGQPWPAGAGLALHVWPTLDVAAVPLALDSTGRWIAYGGLLQPATPAAGLDAYASIGQLTFSFVYSGAESWQGTIWIADLEISAP
jgi:hypothetical protein